MSFSLQLAEFIEKAKGNTEQVVQKVAIDLISAVIDRSPVGNPELWAVNQTAREYNLEVVRFNAALRDDPNNLTKAGRLKSGLKVNDSMDIISPDGYVGGQFRGNWQVTFDTKATGQLDRIDPQGDSTKSAASQVVLGFTSDVGTIWAVNNLPYGPRLEFEGWSSQAPAGMVRVSVTEFQSFVNRAVASLPQ
ncbi:hypothetical protein ACUTAF_02130 [Pseudomonas sp. SP16.1]|uniref:hypothetical protein n=1 Tax=Pseudomonas sp. SP16.1 TaxID=3458854 RepID=UPI0040461F6C